MRKVGLAMKKFIVYPSAIKGSIVIPASKSHTMRAILFGALANGTSTIRNFLSAPDTNHMINACKLLGAKTAHNGTQLMMEGVDGKVPTVEDVIQSGNSGIILRFISMTAALCSSYVVITGDHSIRHQRPMKKVLDALNQLGAFAVSSRGDGFAPLIIKGPLKGGKVLIDGEDSQPISSLLIACSLAEGPTEILVRNPGEKPWIMLTLHWLDRLGITYTNENFERYTLEGNGHFKAFDYSVPGDWSSAAFPIAAALVTQSSLTIENVDIDDPQGDKEIIFVLQKMGANIEINKNEKKLHITPSKLKGIVIDVNNFIDAVTILAVIACFAEGETHLINASVARQKECDRLHSISIELTKMGADIAERGDSLVIRGKPLQGADVNSWNDHRMAMSLAVAGLGAQGKTLIENIRCVEKTFPNFAGSFKKLGAMIEEL